jgi:hypothetical protein
MFAQYAQTLRESPLLLLPIAAMLWFLAIFLGVLVRYARTSAKSLEFVAALPLSDDDVSSSVIDSKTPAKEERHGR